MYGDLNGLGHTHAVGGWKADIRDYARWEYGTEEAAGWLLRNARIERRRTRTPIGTRIRRLFRPAATVPATTAVAAVESRAR